jgi:putative membrane protein
LASFFLLRFLRSLLFKILPRMSIHALPAFNASLNALATVLLVIGLIHIRRKQIAAHRATMITAFGVSCVFLVFYVAHKIGVRGVHTPFGGTGGIRTVYYTMLLSHILLAIAIVPLAIITLRRGLRRDDARHKMIARLTWPVWFYVSVTGVLVYFMLYHWYPSKEAIERRSQAGAIGTLYRGRTALPACPRIQFTRASDRWQHERRKGVRREWR